MFKHRGTAYPLRVFFSCVAEISRGRGDAQTTLGEVGLLSIVCILNLREKEKLLREERDESDQLTTS